MKLRGAPGTALSRASWENSLAIVVDVLVLLLRRPPAQAELDCASAMVEVLKDEESQKLEPRQLLVNVLLEAFRKGFPEGEPEMTATALLARLIEVTAEMRHRPITPLFEERSPREGA